jgi:hypothetical protein
MSHLHHVCAGPREALDTCATNFTCTAGYHRCRATLLLRTCCSTNSPASCMRRSKQGLDGVSSFQHHQCGSKASHACCSHFVLQINAHVLRLRKQVSPLYWKLALIDLRSHGGATGATSSITYKPCSVALVDNTGR